MNSERTQIFRKTISAPMRWIVDNFYFSPYDTVLHFGEGRAFEDTAALESFGSKVFAYDPNSPDEWKRDIDIIDPARGLWAVGVSIYVFNTLLPNERWVAWQDMFDCCQRCVVAVRTDKVNGSPVLGYDGVTTKRDTFQTQLSADAWVEWFERMSPEWASVNLLHNGGHFCIIEVSR